MTIRLRCAACQRKLKVADEALGKKVQCPVCGARFIGRIESIPPPPKPAAAEETVAPAAPLAGAPPAEQPLAETITLPPEEADVPALHPDEAPVVDMLFTEMASQPLEEADPLAFHDEEHVEIVDDVADEEVRTPTRPRKPKQSAKQSAEESEVLEEAEDESAPSAKAPKRKQSRKRLLLILAGLLCALLLGGVGFIVYRLATGD